MHASHLRQDRSSLSNVRYSVLAALWTHHNQTQLQWPAVIIGAALIVVSGIVPTHISEVFTVGWWPRNPDSRFGVGAALFLTGLALLAMVYTMARARQILLAIEGEFEKIEKDIVSIEGSFRYLNHPNYPGGFSAALLLRNCMMIMLVLPMTVFGLWLMLGWVLGTVAEIALVLLSFVFWRRSRCASPS